MGKQWDHCWLCRKQLSMCLFVPCLIEKKNGVVFSTFLRQRDEWRNRQTPYVWSAQVTTAIPTNSVSSQWWNQTCIVRSIHLHTPIHIPLVSARLLVSSSFDECHSRATVGRLASRDMPCLYVCHCWCASLIRIYLRYCFEPQWSFVRRRSRTCEDDMASCIDVEFHSTDGQRRPRALPRCCIPFIFNYLKCSIEIIVEDDLTDSLLDCFHPKH